MFKKVRLVQATLASLSLMGCTTSTTTPQAATTTTPSALLSSAESSTDLAPVESKTRSKQQTIYPTSGDSLQSRTRYINADGSFIEPIQHWIEELATANHLDKNQLIALLKTADFNPKVAQLMAPSKGRIKRSWSTYKSRFIEPIRIQAGLDFWDQHADLIAQTAQSYGVPEEILVAIIGVETIYGRYTGDFRVLDALLTLGFSYPDDQRPERAAMFRKQLADLILLHDQKKLDALQVKGSYAGAMGLPQFMPTSLQHYAVDADNDQRIDLFNSMPDILASVANFLIAHGWQPGLEVFIPMRLEPQQAKQLVDGGLKPRLSWKKITPAAIHIPPAKNTWQTQPLGVIDLIEESQGTAEYRVATENFYAITSYNRSYFYAATVADFAQLLAERRP